MAPTVGWRDTCAEYRVGGGIVPLRYYGTSTLLRCRLATA